MKNEVSREGSLKNVTEKKVMTEHAGVWGGLDFIRVTEEGAEKIGTEPGVYPTMGSTLLDGPFQSKEEFIEKMCENEENRWKFFMRLIMLVNYRKEVEYDKKERERKETYGNPDMGSEDSNGNP